MTELTDRIEALDRNTAYEAAQILAADLGADSDTAPVEHEILVNPEAHQGDLEELAKVLLLATADVDPEAVELAIEGAGQTQFILGGGELVILGYLIVNGLQIVLAKGKTSEEVKTVVTEQNSDGSTRQTETTKKTRWDVSKNAASLLGKLLGSAGKSGTP